MTSASTPKRPIRSPEYHPHMSSLATDPRDLESLLHQAEIAHGHLCAGQILGVRLALLALRRLNIEDPRSRTLPDGTLNPDRKRLVTFVEIDRCATDAIAVVTGCRLGKRALKFRDWGKMAATFVDLASPIHPSPSLSHPERTLSEHSESNASTSVLASETSTFVLASEIGPDFSPDTQPPPKNQGFSPWDMADPKTPTYKAIRIAALESSKQRARDLYPHIEAKNEQQMRAYRELPDSDLFSEQWVAVPLHPRELPGYKSPRIACALCGEGINYDRESILPSSATANQTLCQSCAYPNSRYYQPLP